MKYLKQIAIIMAFSLAGELLNALIPLPVPASIYGLILMFLALYFGAIKLEHVKETAKLLIEWMQVMFIPAAVGLMAVWNIVEKNLLAYLIIMVVSTLVVFAVSGRMTQLFLTKKGGEK